MSGLLVLFALMCSQVYAQQKYDKSFYLIDIKAGSVLDPGVKRDVDSILKLYHHSSNDTLKLNYLKLFSEGLEDPALWTAYNRYLYDYSSKKHDSLYVYYKATALLNMGYEQQFIYNNPDAAKTYYQRADTLFRGIHHDAGLGAALNNMAYLHQHEGNLQEAIEMYIEAGKLFEKEKQALGLTSIYINLGDIYFQNDELDNAETFFKKALVYSLKTGQENVVANVYNQLAAIALRRKNIKVAIDYYSKASAIYEKNKVYSRMALMKIGLASSYIQLKDTPQYVKYTLEAHRISLLSTDLQIKTKIYNKVVALYMLQNDLKNSALFADSAYAFARQINYPDLISEAAYNLSRILRQKGSYREAYDYLLEHQTLNDSIHTNTVRDKVVKSQYELEYNKKDIELKADQEKKDAVRKAERSQQQLILLIVSVALVAIAVFGFMAFRNFRKMKKANLIIEHQKMQVEEKQKEIIDSINYAKRIQQAVLTGEDVWSKVSKEHFILFKPKDIVSGDFYWAYNMPDGRSVFALADCTGHGVPGGFMSMLGNSFLNEIVVENEIFKADEILNKLRAKIIAALEQKGMTEQKDGMDISLCVWNKQDNTLEFAGANNPLWILRASSPSAPAEIIEYKADKMPIGTYLETEIPFNSTPISLQKGDIIYLSTDGYADQFGGDKGKKLKYKPFMDLLIRVSKDAMTTQKTALEKAFEDWRKQYEQVDDVSIIGIRV
jgi:serine phosphatase RsbU (regulator of sigma subunit)/tetratricopeptide (TPR) repeat protein